MQLQSPSPAGECAHRSLKERLVSSNRTPKCCLSFSGRENAVSYALLSPNMGDPKSLVAPVLSQRKLISSTQKCGRSRGAELHRRIPHSSLRFNIVYSSAGPVERPSLLQVPSWGWLGCSKLQISSRSASTPARQREPVEVMNSYTEGLPAYLRRNPSGVEITDDRCYICAALTASSTEGMVAQMEEARSEGAHIAELRLDHIRDLIPERDLPELLSDRILPVIVTFRPKWEGGQFAGDEELRLSTLHRAAELGADFVDIELQVAAEFIAKRQRSTPPRTSGRHTRVIVSSHNYEATPSLDELRSLVAQIQSTGADVVKMATMANDITDVSRVFKVLEEAKVPTIALCMGPRGQVSRLLAPKYGAFLTFGSLGAGKESAPGQLTVRDLVQMYRFGSVNRGTKVLGLIGNPVGHSKSPILYNAAMVDAGLDGIYVPFLVDSTRAFLAEFSSPDFAGFSVTIPHKQEALKCCDEVDPVARAIGAVNTVVRRPSDGKLVGYNTDWRAAIEAIEDGLRERERGKGKSDSGRRSKGETGAQTEEDVTGGSPLQGRTLVVVGAGGAGRAIAFGGKQRGAKVVVTNRNAARAEELAVAVGASTMPWERLNDAATALQLRTEAGGDMEPVLAHTTSVGMIPDIDGTVVAKAALRGYGLVFDAVYTPMETRLLREAVEVGATAVSGVEMFIRQATEQFTLLTGLPAPKKLMRDVVISSLSGV